MSVRGFASKILLPLGTIAFLGLLLPVDHAAANPFQNLNRRLNRTNQDVRDTNQTITNTNQTVGETTNLINQMTGADESNRNRSSNRPQLRQPNINSNHNSPQNGQCNNNNCAKK